MLSSKCPHSKEHSRYWGYWAENMTGTNVLYEKKIWSHAHKTAFWYISGCFENFRRSPTLFTWKSLTEVNSLLNETFLERAHYKSCLVKWYTWIHVSVSTPPPPGVGAHGYGVSHLCQYLHRGSLYIIVFQETKILLKLNMMVLLCYKWLSK